jgi:hypothetical protein
VGRNHADREAEGKPCCEEGLGCLRKELEQGGQRAREERRHEQQSAVKPVTRAAEDGVAEERGDPVAGADHADERRLRAEIASVKRHRKARDREACVREQLDGVVAHASRAGPRPGLKGMAQKWAGSMT